MEILAQMKQTISNNHAAKEQIRSTEVNLHRHNLSMQEQFSERRDANMQRHLKEIQDRDAQIYNTFIVSFSS